MKFPVKVLLGVLSALLLLALLAWTGTFLYWHFHILAAIQVLETPDPQNTRSLEREAAVYRIVDADCRCLPYLVRSLDPGKDVDYLKFASHLIAWEMEFHGAPIAEAWTTELGERAGQLEIASADSSQDRRRKIELIHSWRKEHGDENHPWWRVWSGACRPLRPPR